MSIIVANGDNDAGGKVFGSSLCTLSSALCPPPLGRLSSTNGNDEDGVTSVETGLANWLHNQVAVWPTKRWPQ